MNRREFFRMIFGAGAACVLPGVVEAAPEVAVGDSQKLTWATEEIAINSLTDEQLEWLRKRVAESDCVGEVRVLAGRESKRYTWQRYMEQAIADEMASSHPGLIYSLN